MTMEKLSSIQVANMEQFFWSVRFCLFSPNYTISNHLKQTYFNLSTQKNHKCQWRYKVRDEGGKFWHICENSEYGLYLWTERIGYKRKKSFLHDEFSQDFLFRPPGSGAAGLQVVSGQVKLFFETDILVDQLI